MSLRFLVMTIALATLAVRASASVVQVTSTGFLIQYEATINAPPSKVYEALVGKVGSWWDSEHTYSGDAKNLSLEPRPGGCFCERLRDGGGIEHMRVVYVAPGEVLRMSGALGPLQASGIAGSLTWTLTSTTGGTKLNFSYSVGGFMEGGFEKLAPTVDSVLGMQVQRLKRFVETGNPTPGSS